MEYLQIVKKEEAGNDSRDVYAFVGELDKVGLDKVREEVTNLVESFEKEVLVFDFGMMKFTNSEGVGFIMEIHTHLVKKGKMLAIVMVRDNVMDVFEAIGLDKIVKIAKDLKGVE